MAITYYSIGSITNPPFGPPTPFVIGSGAILPAQNFGGLLGPGVYSYIASTTQALVSGDLVSGYTALPTWAIIDDLQFTIWFSGNRNVDGVHSPCGGGAQLTLGTSSYYGGGGKPVVPVLLNNSAPPLTPTNPWDTSDIFFATTPNSFSQKYYFTINPLTGIAWAYADIFSILIGGTASAFAPAPGGLTEIAPTVGIDGIIVEIDYHGIPPPPPSTSGGIYTITPGKTNDTVYLTITGGSGSTPPTITDEIVMIPNPYIIK
jgi:hypothetical protein